MCQAIEKCYSGSLLIVGNGEMSIKDQLQLLNKGGVTDFEKYNIVVRKVAGFSEFSAKHWRIEYMLY